MTILSMACDTTIRIDLTWVWSVLTTGRLLLRVSSIHSCLLWGPLGGLTLRETSTLDATRTEVAPIWQVLEAHVGVLLSGVVPSTRSHILCINRRTALVNFCVSNRLLVWADTKWGILLVDVMWPYVTIVLLLRMWVCIDDRVLVKHLPVLLIFG